MRAILNFLGFQAAWFAAVLGGAGGWPGIGSLPAAIVALVHLAINRERLGPELAAILAITVFGVLVEMALTGFHLIHYAGTAEGQVLPPVWITALWLGFATLPNASLAWLKGRWIVQAVLGAVVGPVTYWAGVKLGAATLPHGSQALSVVALAWALALPTIFFLTEAISPRK
jgi:hypothetical protein